jgi:hypothetical protein
VDRRCSCPAALSIGRVRFWIAQLLTDTEYICFSLETVACPTWLPKMGCDLLQRRAVSEYIRGAKHLVQHAKYAALGRMSGAHGVFARWVFRLPFIIITRRPERRACELIRRKIEYRAD